MQIYDYYPAGIEEEENGGAFHLKVLPNPSNSDASVSFQLPYAADVQLEIYDMSGRMIACPLNHSCSAGEHSVNLFEELPSGIYIANLKVENKTVTRLFAVLQ